MMKKFITIGAVLVLSLSMLAGCGNSTSNEPDTNTENNVAVSEETTLEATGIKVDGNFGEAKSVSCAEVTNGDVYEKVVNELSSDNATALAIWNIDILNDAGTAIQPDGEVTITLTLPDSLVKANGDTYTVYRQEGDGTQTVLPSEVKGNTIVFATEHFSIYTVVKTDSQAVVEEDSEVAIEDTTENEEVVSEEVVVPEEPVAPKTEYTYSALDKTMYAKSSVNVRDLPSTDGERIGGLSARQEVHVTGQCNETNWYRIDYNGETAYVSNSYLVSERPAEPQPEPEQPKPDTPTECPYELGVWYDMGWYFFKLYPDKNFATGENREYQQILLERYPETADTMFGGPVAAACESKWNGWWASFWMAPPIKGDYVFD